MLARSLLPFAAILILGACGEDQTAEAPATPTSPSTVETAQAPPPATPPATSSTTAAGADTSTNPTATTGSTVSALPAASLESFQGRTYAAGPLTVQFNPDNTFVMNEADGNRKVEGRYAFQDGIVTLSEPTGDIGQASFPMRCRLEPVGTGEFRLAETEGSCARFKDLTFKPATG